jgi:chromosome segregation ATPase
MDIKKELEQIEKMEVEKMVEEKKSEIEQIREKIRTGQITLAEFSEHMKKLTDRINEKMEKMRDIDQRITDYRERISQLEKEKQKLKEEIRDLNVMLSELTDGIKAAMGFITKSAISGKPINTISSTNRGRGFRVHVKTTEQGIRAGLANVNAEFSSMAKAIYALGVLDEGKRTDFKAKLESLARRGLIELQFL